MTIFNPDDTEVSEIVLPDGSTASEVLDPDGNVVFSTSTSGSVVSRDPDDDTNNGLSGFQVGVRFESSVDRSGIDAEISANTSGQTRAYLKDVSAGTIIEENDISALNAGDVFTFTSSLSASTSYDILMDAEGAGFDAGYDDNPAFPYTSSDGNLTLTSGVNGDGTIGDAYCVISVGDLV